MTIPHIPKDITKDKDTGLEIASFDYYSGINYAERNKLGHTVSFKEVREGTHFMVCCGDVMVKVDETAYPFITRRPI